MNHDATGIVSTGSALALAGGTYRTTGLAVGPMAHTVNQAIAMAEANRSAVAAGNVAAIEIALAALHVAEMVGQEVEAAFARLTGQTGVL